MSEKSENKPKRSTEYYKRNFQALENGKRAEFNWAACLFGGSWLVYRKMYLPAALWLPLWLSSIPLWVLLMLIFTFILTKLGVIFDTASGISSVITIAIMFLTRISFGFFANALYYKAVKSKIKKGYHKLEEFSPTAFILAFMTRLPFVGIFFIILFASADHYANPFRRNKKNETFEVDADAINQYLEHDKEHRYGRILSKIIYGVIIIIFAIGTMKVIGRKITSQLENASHKIEKEGNSNKKNNAINSNSAQTGNIAPSAKEQVNSSKRNNANNTDINAQMNDIATKIKIGNAK